MFQLKEPYASGTLPTDHPTPIRLDLYPALATYTPTTPTDDNPAVTVVNVRVILTLDTALVFRDHFNGGEPELIFEQRFNDAYLQAPAYIAEFDEGTLSIERSSGCGCGSRLRGFRPFTQGLVQDRMLMKK